MPDKSCLQCISEINRCFVFKMKCENSNRTLRQLLPEAVAEPLDFAQQKAVLSSVAVQTDDKVYVSVYAQTVKEENISLCHSSTQTIQEHKPSRAVSHKEIQTEYEYAILNDPQLEKYIDDSVTENIIIYEQVETPLRKRKKSSQTSPALRHETKKLCKETKKTMDLLPIHAAPEAHNYILVEDTNMDSDETEILIQRHVEKEKESVEYHRFEFYEESEDADDAQDNEQKTFIFENNEYIYNENYKSDNDSSEPITKSSKEQPTNSSENCRRITRASSKPKRQYKCTHCIMTFVSIKVLKRHLSKIHDIKDTEIIVDYVPATETDENSTNPEEPSSSDNVTKMLNSNKELNIDNVAKPQLMPRERVTSSVNEEMLTNAKYFCEHCQAGFAQRKTLTYHMKHKICMSNNFQVCFDNKLTYLFGNMIFIVFSAINVNVFLYRKKT